MTAGGPVDPTMPLPEGERRGAPQPPEGEPTGSGTLPGAYDQTVAVPPVGPPDDGDPYGPPPGDGDDDGDNRKWLWGILAALGVIVLGVVIALLVTGGDDNGNKTATSSSTSSSSTSTSTSTSTTSTTATTAPGAPVITAYSSEPPTTVSCPNTSTVVPVTLSWSTTDASGVTLSIDNGATKSFAANGSAVADFNCAQASHTYTLTALGANNASVSRTITLNRQTPTTTTTAPPSTTTTT